jgi:DNA primase
MMIRIAARTDPEGTGEAAHARARALDRVLPLIAKVPRPSARELFANRAAELFGLSIGRVEQALRGLVADGSNAPPRVDSRDGRSSRGGDPGRPSTSHGVVPPSAAVRSVPPLPPAQVRLAMLLIDVPHLASLAERNGAVDLLTDPRLSPLVRRVVGSAKSGEDSSLTDLLDLVDAPSQQDVYRQVFAGQFRGSADPVASLAELMHACRREAVEVEIAALERRRIAALDDGRPDEARELSMKKFALLRELDRPPPVLTDTNPTPHGAEGN